MSNKLTLKQETFCQEFVKSGNASASYRIAYPSSLKWKDESVWQKSSKLMTNIKVKARVKELQSKTEEKHSITKDKIVNRLQQVIFAQDSLGVEKIDLNALNKAVDTLNKMQGYYSPEQHEIKQEVTFKTLRDFYEDEA